MEDFGAPNFSRIGQSAIVLECAKANAPAQHRLWALARAARRWAHVGEAVVGAGNLTLLFDRHAIDYDTLRAQLETGWAGAHDEPANERTIEIAVRYGGNDGPDLGDIAQAAGLTLEEAIALHAAANYVVSFVGFLPGFAYLDGLDERLHRPRRTTPRARVPAGSVAMAGAQSGVYPFDSPGGWHLIGRTDARMFDPDREPAALLQPGDRVRFVPA
ncbi:MAG TPA: 5-oxoprolinase subunit PxpB [Verrucomicrobiae bacterium]|nr:5-oxoprolinase subunit PxpB [Verrucomicrobiae bacterium]